MNLDEIEDLIRRYLSAGVAVVIILVAPATSADEDVAPPDEPSVVTIDPTRPELDDPDPDVRSDTDEPDPDVDEPRRREIPEDGEDPADPDRTDEDPSPSADPSDEPQDRTPREPADDTDDPRDDDSSTDDGPATDDDPSTDDRPATDDNPSTDDRPAPDDDPSADDDPATDDGPPTDDGPATDDGPPTDDTDRGTDPAEDAEDPDDPDPSDIESRGPADGSEPGIDDPRDGTGPADENAEDSDDRVSGPDTREADSDPRSDASAEGATAAERYGWGTPDHEDDFTSGLNRWDLYDGPGHAGEGLRATSAVTVEDGILTITGDEEGTTGGMAWGNGQRYGRWEGRVRAPASDPSYNALLLLWPDAEDFPVGGEIDFMEMLDHTRQRTDFFLHHGPDNDQVTSQVELDGTEWHNWAVEWTPDAITGYVDGEEWFRTTDTSTFPPGPMHLCIQLDWFPEESGAEGSGSVRESKMEVDWVRQYALEDVDEDPPSTTRERASTEPASADRGEADEDDDPIGRMFSWS